jgi:hypothetical protein
MKPNRIIIAGGRDFNDYDRLCAFMDQYCLDNDLGPDHADFISGAAAGADWFGELWATSRGYKVMLFPANWTDHGKAAGYIRNKQMAYEATALVAFWDGCSKGTGNMIRVATKAGLKVHIERY